MVVVVWDEPVVVVVDEPAVAITGAMGDPFGADLAIPLCALLFGYAWHVRLRVLPETSRESWAIASSWIVTSLLVAVKGPNVSGADGSERPSPLLGTGLGMGTSMSIGPTVIVCGVAPVAPIPVLAVPAMALFPRAWAASAMVAGSDTSVW